MKNLKKLFLAMLLVTSVYADNVGPQSDADVDCDHINTETAAETDVATCVDENGSPRACADGETPTSINN